MSRRKGFNERFVDLADKVSYAIGTPLNIGFWIVAVVAWIVLGPYTAQHNFMPAWFTSNGFNFPLNTVTTLAELYIGFLIAAASNRAQRALTLLLDQMKRAIANDVATTKRVEQLEETIVALLDHHHEQLKHEVGQIHKRLTYQRQQEGSDASRN